MCISLVLSAQEQTNKQNRKWTDPTNIQRLT